MLSSSGNADEDLERVRQGFLGRIQQEPPMFSAIKVGGERLYAKARRGEACAPSASAGPARPPFSGATMRPDMCDISAVSALALLAGRYDW